MVKTLPLLFLSSLALTPYRAASDDFKTKLVTNDNVRGKQTLISVDTEGVGDSFRIYHYDDLLIDEIDNTAFNGVSFTTLGLTNSVKYINDAVFNNAPSIRYLEFTGSEEEYNQLGLTIEFTKVSFYSFDEGFINYWNENVRPNKDSNICSISSAQYKYVIGLYKNLNEDDLAVVDSYVDKADAKISDSIKELIKHFGESQSAQKNDEWNQTSAITFIIVVAMFGMTSITIFFLLKTRKIID